MLLFFKFVWTINLSRAVLYYYNVEFEQKLSDEVVIVNS